MNDTIDYYNVTMIWPGITSAIDLVLDNILFCHCAIFIHFTDIRQNVLLNIEQQCDVKGCSHMTKWHKSQHKFRIINNLVKFEKKSEYLNEKVGLRGTIYANSV